MSEEIEFLKKRLVALEQRNEELDKQWRLLRESLLEAWRSMLSLNTGDYDADDFEAIALDQIEALESAAPRTGGWDDDHRDSTRAAHPPSGQGSHSHLIFPE